MARFDRKKYKATTTDDMEKLDENVNSKMPQGGGAKAGFHKIEAGDNVFRFFPPHPEDEGGGKTFYEVKCVSFLPVSVNKRDDNGNELNEKEVKRKPIFNAKIHADLSNSLVDIYLKHLHKMLKEEIQDDEEFKKQWGKATNSKTAIKPQTSYAAYANKKISGGWEFGQLEFKKTVKDGLKEQASKMQDPNEPIQVDPYTDPDEGIPAVISKKGEGLKTEYSVELYQEKVSKFETKYVPVELTDEDFENLENVTPLAKKFRNSYGEKDWDMELEGIERFDQENDFGVFQIDEFCDEVEELQKEFDEYIVKNQSNSEAESSEDLPFDKNKAEEEHEESEEGVEEPEHEEDPESPKKTSGKKEQPKQDPKERTSMIRERLNKKNK